MSLQDALRSIPPTGKTLMQVFAEEEKTGEQLKDEGMELAKTNADEEWKTSFISAAISLAYNRKTFTSDDVIDGCGNPPAGSHPNVVGAMMAVVAKQLKLTQSGYVRSTRKSRHAGIISQWIKLS